MMCLKQNHNLHFHSISNGAGRYLSTEHVLPCDLQVIFHFMNSNPSVIHNYNTDFVVMCMATPVTLHHLFLTQFLNLSIQSYTFFYSETLFPNCTRSLQWISAPPKPSAHKNSITVHCSSLAQTAATLTLLQ